MEVMWWWWGGGRLVVVGRLLELETTHDDPRQSAAAFEAPSMCMRRPGTPLARSPLTVGMLASWFRMKYSGSVDGAIAASAPILQFTGLTDPTVYSAITTQTYRDVSPLCASGIEASWAVMQKLGSTPQGLVELSGEDG